MARWMAIILGVLLLATNGFWLYSTMDLAVTQKYRQQEAEEARNQIEALRRLCSKLVGGMGRADALELLNEVSPGVEAYEKEGHLNSAWLSLRVDGRGNVVEVGACQ